MFKNRNRFNKNRMQFRNFIGTHNSITIRDKCDDLSASFEWKWCEFARCGRKCIDFSWTMWATLTPILSSLHRTVCIQRSKFTCRTRRRWKWQIDCDKSHLFDWSWILADDSLNPFTIFFVISFLCTLLIPLTFYLHDGCHTKPLLTCCIHYSAMEMSILWVNLSIGLKLSVVIYAVCFTLSPLQYIELPWIHFRQSVIQFTKRFVRIISVAYISSSGRRIQSFIGPERKCSETMSISNHQLFPISSPGRGPTISVKRNFRARYDPIGFEFPMNLVRRNGTALTSPEKLHSSRISWQHQRDDRMNVQVCAHHRIRLWNERTNENEIHRASLTRSQQSANIVLCVCRCCVGVKTLSIIIIITYYWM